MVSEKILITKDNKSFVQDVRIDYSPKLLKSLSSPLAWKILQELKSEPLYPLQIAKKLNIHEQKVYYHISNLFKAGIIKIVKEKDIRGAVAKFYSPSFPAFAVSLDYGKKLINDKLFVNNNVLNFFKEFNKDAFTGYIVVGSPEPHGPLNSWAKDGHYANIVSMFLGNFIKFSKSQFIDLDININAKEKWNKNFILIGGPGVNVITFKFNEDFISKFDTKFIGEAPSASLGRGLTSSKTKKLYTEPTIGVIQKIVNPLDNTKSIILLAGNSKRGTLAAIIALTQKNDELLKDYEMDKPFCKIVKGFDLSGDGIIDSVEILE